MGKWIIIAGLAGWAGIIALAYRLADARTAFCHKADTYTAEANCLVRTTAARDDVLVVGLTVLLACVIMMALAFARAKAEGSGGSRSGYRASRLWLK